ncbi:class B sortase [Oscillospiraceae bacterium MB08-C2-2]|nr:class B sortase [Oscillospiraceae bacterium MB08-C2-2]
MSSKKIYTGLRNLLIVALVAMLSYSAVILLFDYRQHEREKAALEDLAGIVENNNPPIPSSAAAAETAQNETEPPEPTVLEQYRQLHEQNPDMIGWIKIADTAINYPVMYTADDFYLSHGFDRQEAKNGVPFVDKRCSVEPFGTNTIIYSHNMKNSTMFSELLLYKDKAFYSNHPTIQFDTLYKAQNYDIVAVFESQVYFKNDTVFKHYNFLNAESEESFNAYIEQIKALSLYDTGVDTKYGDELITLMTCSYHIENGRFVVVARREPS